MVAATAGAVDDPVRRSDDPDTHTLIGQAFMDGTPRRFDKVDVASAPASARACASLRATDTVAGVVGCTPARKRIPVQRRTARHDGRFRRPGRARLAARHIAAPDARTRRSRPTATESRETYTTTSSSGSLPSDWRCRERSRAHDQRKCNNGFPACVDDLQEVIQEIRTAIFDLHSAPPGTTRLRQRLDEAIAQFSSPELRTTVQFVGPLSIVDAGLADHAEAVVREAVSNAVRHANATTLSVTVKVEDDLTIEVVDNGHGIPETSPVVG